MFVSAVGDVYLILEASLNYHILGVPKGNLKSGLF